MDDPDEQRIHIETGDAWKEGERLYYKGNNEFKGCFILQIKK